MDVDTQIPSAIVLYTVTLPLAIWGRDLSDQSKVSALLDRYLYDGHECQSVSRTDDGSHWVALVEYRHYGRNDSGARDAIDYQQDRLRSGGLQAETVATYQKED